MPASKYDLNIEKGSSYVLTIIYKASNGQPIDLNGWCARLTWQTNTGQIQSFNTDNTSSEYQFIIIDNLGKLVLQFPAESTNNFNFYSAKYDLELQSPTEIYNQGGKQVERILYGNISIIPRFSQDPNTMVC